MRIALHSLHVDALPETLAVSAENKSRYAAIRKYDFIAETTLLDPARPFGWNRLQMLRRALLQYDWVLSLSPYAVIANYGISLEQVIDDRLDLIISNGPHGARCNQMLLRNTPAVLALLDDVCATADIAAGPIGDQRPFLLALDSGRSGVRYGGYGHNVLSCPPDSYGSPGDFIIDTLGAANGRVAAFDALSKESIVLANREQFPVLFRQLGLLETGAEIGVESGYFSSILRAEWPGRTLYLVDAWRNSAAYGDLQNLDAPCQDGRHQSVVDRFAADAGVKVLRAASVDAAATFPDSSFDWVYIDADHSYKGVLADLHAWYPKVRRGGIMAGHDYIDGYPAKLEPPQWNSLCGNFGVRTAVTEFAAGRDVRVYHTYETDGDAWSWYFVKV